MFALVISRSDTFDLIIIHVDIGLRVNGGLGWRCWGKHRKQDMVMFGAAEGTNLGGGLQPEYQMSL